MDEESAIRIFEKCGAIVKGHFVYAGGLHGDTYINKHALYTNPIYSFALAEGIAEKCSDLGIHIVAAPERGGIILAQWVAMWLMDFIENHVVFAMWAEKNGDDFEFRHGYEKLIAGKRALVVDDVLNTGASALKVKRSVSRLGGIPVGFGALWNRGGVNSSQMDGLPVRSIINSEFPKYTHKECPLCKSGALINTNLGHGKEFLESLKKQLP